jgi:hypothetical protein
MTMLPVLIAAVLLVSAALIIVTANHQRRLGGLPEGFSCRAGMA